VNIQKISAITLRVASMPISMRFYRDELGMKIGYGKEDGYFSSLRTKDGMEPILNLEYGSPATQWGAADLPRCRRRWLLGALQGKGSSSGKSTRCLMGRKVLPYVRSRRSRAVVCPADLAVFQ